MRHYKLLLLLTGILMCFLSCKKDKAPRPAADPGPKPVKEVKVSDELKAWAYFKPGTYWVYRDSTFAYLDSAYVVSVSANTLTAETKDTTFVYEEITIQYIGANYTYYNNTQLYSYPSDRVVTSFPQYGGVAARAIIFEPKATGTVSNFCLPNLTIAGQNYSDLIYYYYAISVATHLSPGQNSQIIYGNGYWKKNVGPVKFNAIFGHCDLLRYHIVQ